MGRWAFAAALLGTVAFAGCKGSVSNPDAAVIKDTAVEMPPPTCSSASGSGTKTKGEACVCGAECASGFCADGYCCDTACAGTCMSCGLATSLGTCTPTPAGVSPRSANQCQKQDPSACGLDGTCDGTGKCRNYQSGTVCKGGSCQADAVTGTFTCDGAGRCKLGASTLCAPFSCNSAMNACFSTCSSDVDCVSGRKCVNGTCGLKMNGAVCQAGSECASSHCADIDAVTKKGVCCNTACSGACRSCSLVGQLGTCSPIPAGQGHALCLKEAQSTCGTTGVCDGVGTCSIYPASTPCGASSCSGATAMNTARACDGLGACQASEARSCDHYKCANGTCNSRCTTDADCADGIACVNNSCGPKVDGQPCTANADCQNQHCVADLAGGAAFCCNTACTGACRSCATGRCTVTPALAADPRNTCVDMTAASCGTDGKCDGAGACHRYPANTTVCAPETCIADVYTGPSTCNASGQCIKPNAGPCYPYRCNVTKCYGACDATNIQCATPNVCGMNNQISSCGLKPPPQPCSANNECTTGFCAQGVCCNSPCTTACQVCNLPGTMGTCTNVASGADPQGMCAMQAASTCGTTGQCAAGQCARWASGTQCLAAGCATPTRTPPSTCNGTGMCITPATMSCAPGRCDTTTLTCVNTCTTNAQCTAPATCVNGSCGLQPTGGTCTATNQCAAGLTCYLTEGSPGVCCNTACSGTCESCRVAGSIGTCTPVAAGTADPDPATLCVAAADPTTCALNGRCAGNNTATNGAGTARCQFFSSTQGCRNRSCVNSTVAGAASTETESAVCNGSGMCGPVVTQTCGTYKCNGVQCATSCSSDSGCVGVTCNTQTGHCGEKLPNGNTCSLATDCTSANCVDGVCCNSTCTGACQACNNTGSVGMCTAVSNGTADSLCLPAAPPCGNTGLCSGGACESTTAGISCAAAICAAGSLTPARACNGSGACTPAGSAPCPGAFACANATSCLTTCISDGQCVGVTCNLTTGHCGDKLADGLACTVNTDCTNGNCVDGVCCNSACAGACQACNLPGSLGICANVTSGADAQCATTANGCLTNTGSCGAGGTCAKVSGVSCGTATCTSPGSGMTAAGTCNGLGTCTAGMTTSCGNFACNGSTCRTSCTVDTDCTGTFKCGGGQCNGRALGATCSAATDCASGNCVDGVCCNGACNLACQACNIGSGATAGMCLPLADGTADAACTAAPPCGNTGSCSGGACAVTASGTQCVAPMCSAGSLTPARTCNGSGTCSPAASPAACPGAFACLDTMSCRMAPCMANGDCSGVSCNLTTHLCGDKLMDGLACAVDPDCTSNHCIDGVCCNDVCTGACRACNLGGLLQGVCSNVTSGPDALCDTTPMSCSTNTGSCGAGGSCVKVGASTSCGPPPSCTSPGVGMTTAGSCDGMGGCTSGLTTPCGNYLCNGTVCRTSCAGDLDCVDPIRCSNSNVPPDGTCTGRPVGAACAAASDCASGVCDIGNTNTCM